MSEFKRVQELKELEQVLRTEKSEFIYVRGRRRVGKSWLLADLSKTKPNCFLFTGEADASTKRTITKMATQWSEFSKTDVLLHRRSDFLNWQKIFEEMENFAKQQNQKITVIFDEIQWIAKKGNGFIGAVKAAWVPWQRCGLFNIIICGSSNKFFHDHVGGEEKILRGLQTAATIWVKPIDFVTIRNQFAPHWKMQEVALLYMMIGGIPYYLERVDPSQSFIHAINKAFFTKVRNLLDETQELLSLEFNKSGRNSVLQVLAALGQAGSTHKSITLKTGLPKPTISKLLQNLVNYKLVYIRKPHLRKQKEGEDFERYYLKDFFLNWYFQVLRPLESDIILNEDGLLFPYRTGLSNTGYHIPNFTGGAFELLIRHLLEVEPKFSSTFFKKLDLYDPNYTVLDYWDAQTQIDLLVEHSKDRVLRVIECKWTDNWDDNWIKEIKAKTCVLAPGFSRKNYIVVPNVPSSSVIKKALTENVQVIGLDEILV